MFKQIYMTASEALSVVVSLFSLDNNIEEKCDTPFNLHPILDTSIIVTAVRLTGAVYFLDEVCGVNHHNFDGNNYNSSQLNGFDRLLMNPYSPVLDDAGTYLGIVSVLTSSVLLTAPSDQWLTIGTMYAETMAFSYGIKELGKLWISRARPFMYYDGFPREAIEDHDWNKSLPSGHTTLAFAGASFTSYVFSE